MDAGLLGMKLVTVGLIWEFVLAMIILYREEGNIRLGTISRRFWLNNPVSARTGETTKALGWWIIPLILLVAILENGFQIRPVLSSEIFNVFILNIDTPGMREKNLLLDIRRMSGSRILLTVSSRGDAFLKEAIDLVFMASSTNLSIPNKSAQWSII